MKFLPFFIHMFVAFSFVTILIVKKLISRSDEHYNDVAEERTVTDKEIQKINKLWEYRYQNIPNKFFGHGCKHHFSHFLSGESKVEVSTIDEMCDWLLGCRYIPDPIKKGERDHWSHPDEFEYERSGDCEDYALWTWRKLKEMRYNAEFMVGKWVRENGRVATHAWVVLHRGFDSDIIETTGSTKERMLKPIEQAKFEYIPFASVDTKLRKKVYMGILHWIRMLAK